MSCVDRPPSEHLHGSPLSSSDWRITMMNPFSHTSQRERKDHHAELQSTRLLGTFQRKTLPADRQMHDDLHLAGMAQRTAHGHLRSVRQSADFSKSSHDKTTEAVLREWLVHLKIEKQFAFGTLRVQEPGKRIGSAPAGSANQARSAGTRCQIAYHPPRGGRSFHD